MTATCWPGTTGTAPSRRCPASGRCPVAVDGIGDITRSRHPARLCLWAGLTPRHYESDTEVNLPRMAKKCGQSLCDSRVQARVRNASSNSASRSGILGNSVLQGHGLAPTLLRHPRKRQDPWEWPPGQGWRSHRAATPVRAVLGRRRELGQSGARSTASCGAGDTVRRAPGSSTCPSGGKPKAPISISSARP